MPDKGWKQFERRVAKLFGAKRRGASTGNGHDGGKTDVIHPRFGIECKLLGRPAWSHFLAAVRQAEENMELGQIPIAVVKKTRARDEDTLVVLRLAIFLALVSQPEIACPTTSDTT